MGFLFGNSWKKKLLSRPPVSSDEFYKRFYSDSEFDKADVIDIRRLIANEYGIAEEHLMPSDRFRNELSDGVFWSWDDGYAILAHNLEDIRVSKGLTPLEPFETIDDYIRQICGATAR